MDSLASKITNSELEIMKILWKSDAELSVAEIREALLHTSDWENSTIKTLLRRLCEKGVVTAAKRDVFCYKAMVSEADYNEYSTQSLIDRLYSGSAKKLVASLLGSRKLAADDIEELRSMFKVGEDNE